jgi:hypothetical protein
MLAYGILFQYDFLPSLARSQALHLLKNPFSVESVTEGWLGSLVLSHSGHASDQVDNPFVLITVPFH